MGVRLKPLGSLAGHKAAVTCLAPLGDDGIASGSEDGTVRIWDADSGRSTRAIRLPQPDDSVGGVCAGEGATAHCVLASQGQSVYGYDLRAPGVVLRTSSTVLPGARDEVGMITLGPGGDILAAADDDGDVQVFDLVAGQRMLRLEGGHESICTSVAFRPHTDLELHSGGLDAQSIRWDARRGEIIEQWSFAPALEEASSQLLNPRHVHSLGFLDNGAAVAFALGDGTLEMRHATSGERLASVEAHRAAASQVHVPTSGAAASLRHALRSDELPMLSAGNDCALGLWACRPIDGREQPQGKRQRPSADADHGAYASLQPSSSTWTVRKLAVATLDDKPNWLTTLAGAASRGPVVYVASTSEKILVLSLDGDR